MYGKLQRRVIFRRISFSRCKRSRDAWRRWARFLARTHSRERTNVPRKRLRANDERRRASRSSLVSAFLGPRATTPSQRLRALLRFCPEHLPSLVAARFLISLTLSLSLSLSLSPTRCPPLVVILVVPLSAGARAKAGPRE